MHKSNHRPGTTGKSNHELHAQSNLRFQTDHSVNGNAKVPDYSENRALSKMSVETAQWAARAPRSDVRSSCSFVARSWMVQCRASELWRVPLHVLGCSNAVRRNSGEFRYGELRYGELRYGNALRHPGRRRHFLSTTVSTSRFPTPRCINCFSSSRCFS